MPPDESEAFRLWQEIRLDLDRLVERLHGPEQAMRLRQARDKNLRWSRALGQPTVPVPSLALDWGRN